MTDRIDYEAHQAANGGHDVQIKRVGVDGATFILKGKLLDAQWVILESFIEYLDRLKEAAIYRRGIPGIERMVWENGEQKIIGDPYTNSELYELLHLLRPLILHNEPASFSSVRAILGRCFRDKALAAELKEIQYIFDHGQLAQFMQIQIGKQKLFDETLLRTWLNGTQYHTDIEKAASWRDFKRSLSDESTRVLLINQLRDKVNALMLIAQIVRAVVGDRDRRTE